MRRIAREDLLRLRTPAEQAELLLFLGRLFPDHAADSPLSPVQLGCIAVFLWCRAAAGLRETQAAIVAESLQTWEHFEDTCFKVCRGEHLKKGCLISLLELQFLQHPGLVGEAVDLRYGAKLSCVPRASWMLLGNVVLLLEDLLRQFPALPVDGTAT